MLNIVTKGCDKQGLVGRIFGLDRCSGVGIVIDTAKRTKIHLGVDLGGADILVAKHILDGSQITASR